MILLYLPREKGLLQSLIQRSSFTNSISAIITGTIYTSFRITVKSVLYIQRQIDLLLKEFADFCKAYLNDIVLEKYVISLEPKKAYIAFPKVSLLGQRVNTLGITTPDDKIRAIARLEFPRTLY
ncbi:hypothetical protein N7501_007172 [Penicillium viridicatum]|nr:hypothetical protein N7501_007172 [Penicillium viridicatum]